jgi:hypothetical protein
MSAGKIENNKIPGLEKLPLLKYLKEPAQFIEHLYERYPDGGEYGWFAFVYSLKSFCYWDIEDKKWALLQLGSENVNLIRYMVIEREQLFMGPKDSQKIRSIIYDGYNRDVTNQYAQLDIQRDSGDYYSDELWNNKYGLNKGFLFDLTFKDLNYRDGRTSTLFTLIAKRGNETVINYMKIENEK